MARHDFSNETVMTISEARRSGFFKGPREVDPGVALLEEIHRTAGYVRDLEKKCHELEESELVWATVMETTEERVGGQGGDYSLTRKENRAVINIWWQMLQQQREHLARVSTAALKAGVEERRLRIAERGVDALEEAVGRALHRLGLDPQSEEVRNIIGEELRTAIQGGFFEGGDGSAREPVVVIRKAVEAAMAGPTVVEGSVVEPREDYPRKPKAKEGLDW